MEKEVVYLEDKMDLKYLNKLSRGGKSTTELLPSMVDADKSITRNATVTGLQIAAADYARWEKGDPVNVAKLCNKKRREVSLLLRFLYLRA